MAALACVCAWGLTNAAAAGMAKTKASPWSCAWEMRTSVAGRGYAGHFSGILEIAGPFDAAGGICMLQWWAPLRRQHAGRFASEFAERANRGETIGRLKNSSNENARRRRTA